MTTPDWPTADQAYQHHHAACPHCRAAGLDFFAEQLPAYFGHASRITY